MINESIPYSADETYLLCHDTFIDSFIRFIMSMQ